MVMQRWGIDDHSPPLRTYVYPSAAYAEAHRLEIENIPIAELVERSREWSPKERIVTVCAKGGGRSAQAAQMLRDMGFGRTWWL